jgi:hypothetical protein
MGFVVDKVAMEQVSLRVSLFSLSTSFTATPYSLMYHVGDG